MKNIYLVTTNFEKVLCRNTDQEGMELYTSLDVLDEDTFISGDIKSFYEGNKWEKAEMEKEMQENSELQEVTFKDILEYLLKKELAC